MCINIKVTLSIVFLLSGCIHVVAQQSFLPQNLGKSVNSELDEFNPVISPDEKNLYFNRSNHPENTYGTFDSEDIWVSEFKNGQWGTAKHLPQLNVGRYNSILSISPDGKTILINGIYNKKGTFWYKRGLSMCTQTASGWSVPQRLKVRKMKRLHAGFKSNAAMSADGKIIVMSLKKMYNNESSDIYWIQKTDGEKWKKPVKIKSLSSKASEDAPFLSKDNKTIYFSSDRENKGSYDLYVAKISADDFKEWSLPRKLSDTINSNGYDSYFKTNVKGSYAFFASSNKSVGNSDIFKVKLFEENPYVLVKGQVLNTKTNMPLPPATKFSVMIDGKEADSVKINADSASFKIKLKLGKKYTIKANVKNYTAQGEIIDVTTQREFTTRQQTLWVTPYSYVLVRGRFLVNGTSNSITALAKPSLWIDNVLMDTAQVNLDSGTYSVKLKHGRVYNMQVRALKHDPVPAKLDLSAVDSYQEINKDLFAEPEKMATITGKIFDKRTGKVFPPKSPLRIVVDNRPEVIVSIDSATSSYELKLPPGVDYTISATAPNYYPVYENIQLTGQPGNTRVYKDLYIVPIEVGQSIRINNIFFESGKSVLKKESFSELDKVASFLSENTSIKIEISGHTDNVGKAETNLKLSLARAKTVADYIISKGISKDRIASKGYGLTKPVAPNTTKEGKALNRRVEFTILGK